MHEYSMKIKDIIKLTKSQILLLVEKIKKRIKRNQDFQISLHGGKPKNEGLNVKGATPIEHVIENQINDKKTI
jgi:hypothetical protein